MLVVPAGAAPRGWAELVAGGEPVLPLGQPLDASFFPDTGRVDAFIAHAAGRSRAARPPAHRRSEQPLRAVTTHRYQHGSINLTTNPRERIVTGTVSLAACAGS